MLLMGKLARCLRLGSTIQQEPRPSLQDESSASSTKQYKIGEHTVLLNQEHMLPEIQSQHALYDCFLPILCNRLDHLDYWIIDVGANVGDTVVAVAQTCRNPILCIEGDDQFFELLQHNVEQLFANRSRAVTPLKALVGSGRFEGNLTGDGTSARLTHGGPQGQRAVALDDLAIGAGLPLEAIVVIKVDTDGYDSDVIMSARKILAASRPVLFWENYFSTLEQMRDLEALCRHLGEVGYRFWVFDNFGNVMLRECSLDNIYDLNHYVASQEFHNGTRTIYYTDILAATDDKLTVVREAISTFRVSVIERK